MENTILQKSKREVEYYRKRAEEMLKNAYPLMDIYRSEQENELTTFLLSNAGKPGGCRGIYSTLPLYTISEELLDRILTRNSVEAEQKERIKKHAVAQRQRVLSILSSKTLEDEMPDLLSERFQRKTAGFRTFGTIL